MPSVKKRDLTANVQAAGELVHGKRDAKSEVVERHAIPPKAGWKLGRIFRHLQPIAQRNAEKYWQDRRSLFEQYGERDEDGEYGVAERIPVRENGKVVGSEENPKFAEFKQLYDALEAEQDETVECPYGVKLSDFGDAPVGDLVGQLGDLVEDE